MSHTRPMEDPIEIDPYRPPAPITVEGTGHSVKTEINNDHSVNEHLPYIWFNGIMSAFGMMCGIAALIVAMIVRSEAIDRSRSLQDSAIRDKAELADKLIKSENHWRNDEVDLRNLQSQMQELQYARSEHPRR